MSMRKFLFLCLVLATSLAMQAQQVMRMEYFLDTDPGHGKGHSIGNLQVGANQLTFDVSDAAAGLHVLSVRAQDTEGHWSQTLSRTFYVARLQDIVYVEYFIDTDPGIGNGTPVPLPDIDYRAHLNLNLDVSTLGLSVGEHKFFVRGKDALGQWTDLTNRKFTIYKNGGEEPVSNGDLSRLEYFFDEDPGYGKGFPLGTPKTGVKSYLMSFESVKAGVHVLSLRAQDDVGHWSQTLSRPIYVIEPCGEVTYVEYFFDVDPGEGQGLAVKLPTDISASFAFEVSVEGLSSGSHKLFVRARTSDGRWSELRSAVFEVSSQSGIDGLTSDGKRVIIYDLQGRKIGTDTSTFGGKQKGIYIINGRKTIRP